MTLARYVAHTRPTSAQIVLEPDAALTEAVRRELPLPKRSGVKVRPVDGRTGIAAMAENYTDLVIVDAFAGARVPKELSTREWFADVRRVLAPDGTLVVNLTDMAPFGYAKKVLAGVAERFAPAVLCIEPATIKGHRFGNLVVAAGPHLDIKALTRRAAGSAFPYRILAGSTLTDWIGGARPYTDVDAEPSPAPPDGPTAFR